MVKVNPEEIVGNLVQYALSQSDSQSERIGEFSPEAVVFLKRVIREVLRNVLDNHIEDPLKVVNLKLMPKLNHALDDVVLLQMHGGDLLRQHVGILALSNKARTICSQLGIYSVADLISFSSEELLEAYHCGEKTLKEVKEKLLKHGLYLAGDRQEKSAKLS